MKYTLLIPALLIVSLYIPANSTPHEDYIEKYKHLAIAEMERTNIPASITLAQGLHESALGKSELATLANNHFGIKCKNSWQGATFYKKDDDKDKDGTLIESCFRSYLSVEESYRDHSEFLMTRPWYAPLFDLEKTDYKGWAYGLKDAGYATDPKYPQKLIASIERWKLYQYDKVQAVPQIDPPTMDRSPHVIFSQPVVFTVNDVKVILAKNGDTPIQMAQRTGVKLNRILEYNERLTYPDQNLIHNERVFIQQKKKEYKKGAKYHRVQPGEDLYIISQWYGIRLENLAKRNRMHPSGVPMTGELIKLKGRKIKKSKAPKWNFQLKPSVNPRLSSGKFHTVKAGENLYKISRKYNIPTNKIIKYNKLNGNTIFAGQVLKIS